MLVVADQVVVSAANFFTVLWMARRLPPTEFAAFSLAMMAVLLLANAHRALFTQPLNVLGAAEGTGALLGRLRALLAAHVVAIPVGALVLLAASWWFFPDPRLFWASAIYLGTLALQEMVRRYWHTAGQYRDALLNDVASYGGQVALLLLLGTVATISHWQAFLIMSATSLGAFLLGLRSVRRAGAADRLSSGGAGRFGNSGAERLSSVVVLRGQWKLSKWLLLTVLAAWGASQVYPFLVSPLGAVAVASFAACRNLVGVFGVLLQSVGNYLPTKAAALLQREGAEALRRDILRTMAWSTVASALMVAVIIPLAPLLLSVVYGGVYDDAVQVFRIMAAGAFFWLLAVVLGSYSLAMEDSRASLVANLGGASFTVTAGVWLIGAYGLPGAALATSLSIAVATVLQGWLVFSRLRSLQNGVQGSLGALQP